MKRLSLQSGEFITLESSYKSWLEQLGYSAQSVNMFPGQLREYLHWLESNLFFSVDNITEQTAGDFMDYFKTRPNERRGGGLSAAHINKQLFILNLLFRFLYKTDQLSQKVVLEYVAKQAAKPRLIVSREQIKLLYESCSSDPLGDRDRAMLSVYYGCGVRRSEGVNLLVDDVLFERRLLHVRKSKNGWERYVPMALGVRQDLERYIYGARKLLSGKESPGNLFLSDRGHKVSGVTLLKRLKDLLKYNGLSEQIGLHSLRHSIATHLLEAKMSLEEVGHFLGHRQLDSTQVYTHIKVREWKKD